MGRRGPTVTMAMPWSFCMGFYRIVDRSGIINVFGRHGEVLVLFYVWKFFV